MSLQLLDGIGKGFLAAVNSRNQLLTRSVAEGPLEDAVHIGNAAYWNSTFALGSTNVEAIYIQNTESDLNLHITRFQVSSTVDTIWTLFEVTSSTAAGGTVIAAVNPLISSGVARSENAFGDAPVTGGLSGITLFSFSTLAKATEHFFLEGSLTLGNTDAIALTADADGTVHVNFQGFWSDD